MAPHRRFGGSSVAEIFIFLSSNKKCPLFVKKIFSYLASTKSYRPPQFFAQNEVCSSLLHQSENFSKSLKNQWFLMKIVRVWEELQKRDFVVRCSYGARLKDICPYFWVFETTSTPEVCAHIRHTCSVWINCQIQSTALHSTALPGSAEIWTKKSWFFFKNFFSRKQTLWIFQNSNFSKIVPTEPILRSNSQLD